MRVQSDIKYIEYPVEKKNQGTNFNTNLNVYIWNLNVKTYQIELKNDLKNLNALLLNWCR